MSLPTPYYQDEAVTIYHGDCREILRTLPDASVDSVVTDPPYGLSFMGKKWDYDVPSVEIWAECLRVLKPGGYLLAFAGTRTQHRMAVRIEDAGFEIRDMIAWVYGSGFPKSLDVSKAIDQQERGAMVREKLIHFAKVRGIDGKWLESKGVADAKSFSDWTTGGHVPSNRNWELVKAALEVTPEEEAKFEREVLGQDTKARAVGSKSALPTLGAETEYQTWDITAPATDTARQWEGWGTALKPALEPITMARKPLIGTVAENVLAHGTGGINIDACRIPSEARPVMIRTETIVGANSMSGVSTGATANGEITNRGRWPANLIHDGSEEVTGLFPGIADENAARFFYTAKASKEDRDEGLEHFRRWVLAGEMTGGRAEGSDGLKSPRAGAGRTRGGKNIHPTVKPTALMQYLCRLVTQPGGVCLDPFMGSGSTGKAALLEGFQFIGIEREADYLPIAKDRILSARRESVAVRHIDLQGKLL